MYEKLVADLLFMHYVNRQFCSFVLCICSCIPRSHSHCESESQTGSLPSGSFCPKSFCRAWKSNECFENIGLVCQNDEFCCFSYASSVFVLVCISVCYFKLFLQIPRTLCALYYIEILI